MLRGVSTEYDIKRLFCEKSVHVLIKNPSYDGFFIQRYMLDLLFRLVQYVQFGGHILRVSEVCHS